MAKQAIKIPARQADTRMVRARTFIYGEVEGEGSSPLSGLLSKSS